MRPEDFGIGTLFEKIRDAVIVAEARSQRIVLWNARATQIFGYSASEALELRIEALVPEHLKLAHRGGIARYAETGHGPYIDSHVPLELPAIRKSGEEIYVEVSLSPIERVDETDGNADFVLAFVRDVTERKWAGEALKRQEERYRIMLQNVSDVVGLIHEDGIVRHCTPSIKDVLGYEPEEIVGINAFTMVHPDDLDEANKVFGEILFATGLSGSAEVRGRHKDGSWRLLRASGSSVLDEPNVRAIVFTFCDVTESRRMEEEVQRSVDALLTIHQAGQLFRSSLNEDEICRNLLEMARHVAGLSAAVIRLEEGRPCHAVGDDGFWHLANGSSEARAAQREVLSSGKRKLFELRHPDLERGRLVGLCLPLRGKEQVIGVLEAYGPEDLRELASMELLGSLANQAASALEYAWLYGMLVEREQKLQVLVGKLMAAHEEERRRVAYDVHDGIAQVAMGAHQQLQAFFHDHPPRSADARRRLARAMELVHRTTVEARHLISDLRPTVLDDLGLAAAVRAQVDELHAEGLEASYDEDLGEERLPAEMETALYRVVQEALANVRKHAETDRVRVALTRRDGAVRLEVRDWGRGFDPTEAASEGGPGERVGFSSMRERISLLEGNFEIRSQPGIGTSMIAEVPIAVTDEGNARHAR
jgi:PAS domain S-box-containing protein